MRLLGHFYTLYFFFTNRFCNHKNAQNAYKGTKIKNASKKHLRGKYSLIRLFAFSCLCPSAFVPFSTFDAFGTFSAFCALCTCEISS